LKRPLRGVGKGYRAPYKVLFWRKCVYVPETGCVVWVGGRNSKGYGQFRGGGKTTGAHKWIWEQHEGPVPDGYELDHLCRNRACVNLLHLEVVTHRENVLRGETNAGINARKTHCIRGHEFTPENTYTYIGQGGREKRSCRICIRAKAPERQRRWRARQKAAA
jgi:hypothetical protein